MNDDTQLAELIDSALSGVNLNGVENKWYRRDHPCFELLSYLNIISGLYRVDKLELVSVYVNRCCVFLDSSSSKHLNSEYHDYVIKMLKLMIERLVFLNQTSGQEFLLLQESISWISNRLESHEE